MQHAAHDMRFLVWNMPVMVIVGCVLSLLVWAGYARLFSVLRRSSEYSRIVRMPAFGRHRFLLPRAWPLFLAGTAAGGAVLTGFLAAAQPTIRMQIRAPQFQGMCVGVGIDISLSMLAPVSEKGGRITRFEKSLAYGADLANLFLPGDVMMLTVFAGTANVAVPGWTKDRERLFLKRLRMITPHIARSLGKSGSNIPRLVREWLPEFAKQSNCRKVGIVISDGEPYVQEGEDIEQDILDALEHMSLSEEHVELFLVIVGDPSESSRIPVYDDQGNLETYESDKQARFIRTKPDLDHIRSLQDRLRFSVFYAADSLSTAALTEMLTSVRRIESYRTVETSTSIAHWFAGAHILLLGLFFIALIL